MIRVLDMQVVLILCLTGQLLRACVELAKAWRTDKYLRKLDALMIVADAEVLTHPGLPHEYVNAPHFLGVAHDYW